jgi:hypothetical protein
MQKSATLGGTAVNAEEVFDIGVKRAQLFPCRTVAE